MHYGVNLGDMQNLWRMALHETDGSCSERSKNDAVEQQFWHHFFQNKKDSSPDSYSIPIASAVMEILGSKKPDTILKIGPGWGNYTFSLSSLCRELTCLDISSDVLEYLTNTAKKKNIQNIRTICSKWETAVLPQKYSVVFAYNCFYRMLDIRSCLEKIQQAADFHVIGMTSGPEQPYFKDVEQELGVSVNWHRFDYIYLTNILYQMGIDVNCKIVPLSRIYEYSSMDEVVEKECSRILDKQYDRNRVREILSKYYKPIGDSLQFVHHFCGAILYW